MTPEKRPPGSGLNIYLRVIYDVLADAGRELDNSDRCVLLALVELRCRHLATRGSKAWDEFLQELLGDAA